MKIPEDISSVLREIDQSLKEKGIPPHSRPILAVIEFGKRFDIGLPLAKLPSGAPPELIAASVHTDNIYSWYKDVYGDLLKTDFSEKAKVAVLADGDIWEMRIQLIYGTAVIEAAHSRLCGQPFQRHADMHSGVRGQNPCGMLSV